MRKYLSNVFHVLELSFNLFSAGTAPNKKVRQYCDQKKCTFMKNGNIVAVGERKKGKLFIMKFKVITNEHQANMGVCNSLFFWHKRMAHQNVDQVKETLRS